MNGGLIVFEGPDGTGKSSLCKNLVDHLISVGRNVLPLSFPGRTEGTIGKIVYDIHHHADDLGVKSLDPTALQCLHIAAHLDTITTRILPEVARGSLVVLDRYWWSTLVYGVVGGADRNVIEKLIEAEVAAWDWLLPQALFLVDRERPLREEPLDLWEAWRAEYLALAKKEKETRDYPVHLIANNDSEETALARVCELLLASNEKESHD